MTTGSRPYRSASFSEDARPQELVYTPPDTAFSLAAFVAECASALAYRARGRAPRRRSGRDAVVFRLHRGELTVSLAERTIVTASLHDVLDVELDTRTVEKLRTMVRPDGVMGSGASVSLDVARVVLVVKGAARALALSESYGSYSQAVDFMGKLRHFLRKGGWVPDDERGPF